MRRHIGHLDDLLRGRQTGPEFAHDSSRAAPLRAYLPLAVALGVLYGFFMGWHALAAPEGHGVKQMISSTIKLPALFMLTLAVTFPSMYVFSALAGSRLGFLSALRLALAGIVVSLAVAASLGPILAFFTLSTESYSFMVLLNVALLGIAGLVGLGFLLRAMRNLVVPPESTAAVVETARGADEASPAGAAAAARTRAHEATDTGPADLIFRVWVVLFAVVGAQMGWILRPFIGSTELPFEWIRGRQGNFLLGVYWAVRRLLNAD